MTIKDQTKAAIMIVAAVGDAIRTLGRVPEGELYARLMDMMSLNMFQIIINKLIESNLVKRTNNVLIWTGPEAK